MKKKFLFVALILISCVLIGCSPDNAALEESNIQTWESNTGITLRINNEDLIVEMIGSETTYGRIDRPITGGGTYVVACSIGGQLYGGYFDVSQNMKTALMGSVYYKRVS